MMDCTLFAIQEWPDKPTMKRDVGQFRVGYTRLLDDLCDQLRQVGAKDVELAVHTEERVIRRFRRTFDGWPKTDIPVIGPGVILRFSRRDKDMEFRCDQYKDWQHNLRGISLTLEALRAVRRYGATQHDEQYRGYERQIPAASPLTTIVEELEVARKIVALAGGDIHEVANDRDAFGVAFRQASAKVISQYGADSEELRAFNASCDILKRRHRI